MSDSDDDEGLDEEESGGEGEADGEGAPKRKLSGKKLILFVGAPVLVIVLAVVGLIFTGIVDLGGSEDTAEEGMEVAEEEEEGPPKEIVFFDLPEMLVNLNSSGRQTNYLKLTVSLELDDPLAVERLEKLLPRIIDNFQVYLRELRVEDLSGSAGVYRLKEELLARVNAAVEPIHVIDVLFKEMLVQ